MFIIIHELPPIDGVRQFKAHPHVYHDEMLAAHAAQETACRERARAWACEIPLPPSIAPVADMDEFVKKLHMSRIYGKIGEKK